MTSALRKREDAVWNRFIGRKITEHLAAEGCSVYATARKEEDLKALGTIKNAHPLRLDVDRATLVKMLDDALADARPRTE